MKSLQFAGNSKVEVIDVPEPTPTADQVVIDIKVSALCGSEMGVFRSPGGRPGNPGHEFAGEVIDTNGHGESSTVTASAHTSSSAAAPVPTARPATRSSARTCCPAATPMPSASRCRPATA